MGKCNKEFCVRLLCEFLASMFVQFIGCAAPTLLSLKTIGSKDPEFISPFVPDMSVLINRARPAYGLSSDPVTYSLAWGGAVLVATQAFRIISGAHINPCISVAAMIVKEVEILDGFLYILVQLFGSAFGFGLSRVIFMQEGSMEKYFCLTAVSVNPWWKSLLIEFFLTGAWVFAMCASWNEANESMLESISLRIGLTVIAATMAGGVFTGASMNPFRTMWSIIIGGYYKYCYVYFIMPLAAAILIAVLWRFLYMLGEKGGND